MYWIRNYLSLCMSIIASFQWRQALGLSHIEYSIAFPNSFCSISIIDRMANEGRLELVQIEGKYPTKSSVDIKQYQLNYENNISDGTIVPFSGNFNTYGVYMILIGY